MVTDDSGIKEFVADATDKLLPLLRAAVIPLYLVRDIAPIPHGTGTLFQVADSKFLVTAAHVFLDAMRPECEGLYTHDFEEGSQLIPLDGKYHFDNDQDIAVLCLSETQTRALSSRKYLRVSDADRTMRQLDEGWYVVHGYPACWTRVDLSERTAICRPYTRITRLYEGTTSVLMNFNEHRHVLLDHRDFNSLNPNSLKEDTPEHVRGISGSSVWQLCRDGDPLDAWTPDHARIVAVETAVYKSGRVIRGTRWLFAYHIIQTSFPELQAPLDIVIPEKAPPNGNVDGLTRIVI